MSEVVAQDAEETVICQFCKRQTHSDFNFCVECDNQIKCLNCGRKTFPNKTYCLACSQPLVDKPVTSQAPNQYERDVKRDGDKYEERTRFALSDNAVHEIAPFIINQTMPGNANSPAVIQPPALPGNPPEETVDTTYEDETPKKSPKSDSGEQQSDDNSVPPSEPTPTNNSSLSQFFDKDGDKLVVLENDFKGAHWAEQQRNFILLYTKAHKELLGKPIPNKEAYKILAVSINIYDLNNFTTYVNRHSAAFMTQRSDGLVLNAAGEKEVAKIITLMEDESKKGHPYWSRAASGPKQQSHLSKDDKDKVAKWVVESGEINLGSLDVRDITVARDYALLAYWLIISHLKKADAVKWNEAMLFLTSKHATSVSGGSFSKAMVAKESEKYFVKTNEGTFYLTPAGQQLVEDWISGTKSVKKTTANT